MSTPFQTNNPGIGGIDELTAAEETTVQEIDGITHAKGTLAVSTATVWDGLAVGTNDQVLTAASGETTGLKWATGGGNVTGDTASADKELVRFNGTGGKTIESPVTDLSTTTATLSDNADLTLYDNVNDGNPIIAFGSSATERLQITASYASAGVALEFVEFDTPTGSATADRGEYRFKVDAALIATIDDGGIELADAKAYFIDTSNVLSETTLGSTVTGSSLTSVGTLAGLTLSADINLDGNNIDNGGVIFLKEQAEADAIVAGSGQLWVDLATPNVLKFTDDADTDFTIAHNATTTLSSLVTVSALDSGSITSGFGTIDTGASNITTTGTVAAGNVTLGTDGTISALTLTEKASIALDPAGGADGDYSGITITGTGGATLAFGDLIYLQASDSRWELADADAVGTAGDIFLGMAVTSSTDGGSLTILLVGQIRADAAFPVLTIGDPVYAGTTAGDIQVAAPTLIDDVVRVVGFALTADEIYFNPSQDHITVTG